MSKPEMKLSQLLKRFKELRLVIAYSIVCNNEDIRVLLADIDSASHTKELLDEYSLRYFLIWLGTKYGLNLYTKNIVQKSQELFRFPQDLLMTTNWYPFLSDYQLRNEEQTLEEVLQHCDNNIPSKLDYIGIFYESLTTHSLNYAPDQSKYIQIAANTKYNRRIKGQFYTPPNIVSYCYQEAFDNLETELINLLQTKEKNFTVLDPACGTGNFLVGFLDHAMQAGFSPSRVIDLVTTSLHGMDLDGRASALTRFSILLKTALILKSHKQDLNQAEIKELVNSLSTNISTTDSTFSTLNNKSGKTKQFDLVITNPPYISYGSRNQQAVPDSTSKLFKKFYPDSSEYKIRLNSVFQDIAFRFCKPKGRTVLFVPDSFLTGRRYAKLRKIILETSKIISLSEFPDNSIANATVGRWCVSVFEKYDPNLKRTNPNYKIKTVSFCSGTKSGDKQKYSIDLNNLVTNDHCRFQILFCQDDDLIFQSLKKLAPLKTMLRGHTGIRSRIGQKKVISQKKLESDTKNYWKRGLISGSSVTPYKISWSGDYLNTDPKNLFSGGFDPTVVENKKILVRQTGDRIVAALDTANLYHLNNVHSFSNQKLNYNSSFTLDLNVLVAILNSSLFCYLYRIKTRETGRALAQIDIETVEEMPLPEFEKKNNQKVSLEITQLSRELAAQFDHEKKQAVDSLVYQLYGLNQSQIEHIETFMTEKTKAKIDNSISSQPQEANEDISKEESKITSFI